MHKFDVTYNLDNYYEYYKFVLIKQRIVRDLLFCVLFIGIAVYWWVDQSESTAKNVLPIFAIIMGVVFPLMNLLTLPMLKKQLNTRQAEIARTHIAVTFNEEDILYENLSEIVTTEVKEDINKNNDVEPEFDDDTSDNDDGDVNTDPVVDEVKEEVVVETNKDTGEGNLNPNTAPEEERTFKLNYNNFLSVKETKNLFLFYLDRQTVVILPKSTYIEGDGIASFKQFILSKINNKRVKFIKEK